MHCPVSDSFKTSNYAAYIKTMSIRSVIRLVFLKIVILCLLAAPAMGANEPVDESRQILLHVIEALKAVESLKSGRGTARVSVHDYMGEHKQIMDFVFKNRMSRSDSFPLVDGARAERRVSWSLGRDAYCGCNEFDAVVQKDPARQFFRQLGYDFHPDTFLTIGSRPLAKHLENLVRAPSTISTKLDDNGVLHVTSNYEDHRGRFSRTIRLDKNKGFRLLSYDRTRAYTDEPVRWAKWELRWRQYGSTWYVEGAKYEENATITRNTHIEATGPPVEQDYVHRIEFSVTDFTPNVDVNDSEFTLDGLKLPSGMTVVDEIAGITYKAGVPPVTTEHLEVQLPDAEFPKRIRGQLGPNDINQISDDPCSPLDPNKSASAAPTTADKDGPDIGSYIVVVIVLLFLALPAALIVLKRRSVDSVSK